MANDSKGRGFMVDLKRLWNVRYEFCLLDCPKNGILEVWADPQRRFAGTSGLQKKRGRTGLHGMLSVFVRHFMRREFRNLFHDPVV